MPQPFPPLRLPIHLSEMRSSQLLQSTGDRFVICQRRLVRVQELLVTGNQETSLGGFGIHNGDIQGLDRFEDLMSMINRSPVAMQSTGEMQPQGRIDSKGDNEQADSREQIAAAMNQLHGREAELDK